MQLDSSTAYKSNPLLKQRGVQIDFTKEQVQEVIKCSSNPEYFLENYIKVISLDDGIVPFIPYPFQRNLIDSFHNNRFSICKLPRQPLALDTPIQTPTGWTTMGDIEVGDLVYSPSGKSVPVIKKTDPYYDADCYKLTFDNGEEIVADSDHRWKVSSNYLSNTEEGKVVTTTELFKIINSKDDNKRGKGKKGSYFIFAAAPLEYPYIDIPLDPYTLGLWLGDGTKRSGVITAHFNDYLQYQENVSVQRVAKYGNSVEFKVSGLYQKLKNLNLICNKHIPEEYLRCSYFQRLELLRGLMDTDGSVKLDTRSFEFYQKDKELCEQVRELLSSLGIKSNLRRKRIKDCWYHTVSFTTTETVFKLQRKIDKCSVTGGDRPQSYRHYIHKIEKTKSVPVACITVDSDEHLFLCGRSNIPTHNSGKSVTVTAYLIHQAIFRDNINIAILANKRETAFELMAKLQTSYENLPKWLQQGVLAWNKGSIELENGSRITASSTSSSAVRGFSYNIVMLDEFAFVPTNVADDFFSSVYPTISSGKSTKVIIVSTPNGMNHFYKLWNDAEKGRNSYRATEAHWSEVPGRDEAWKQETIANTSEQQFQQEFECVWGPTTLEVLDKETGEIKNLTIQELYDTI